MAKTTAYANSLLLLVFNNTNISNLGDSTGVRGSTTAGSLYASLHTADPTTSGTQTSSEITYTSYGRVAVARSGSGWAVTSNSVSPVAAITFPAGTGGSGTATFFGVGASSTGTGFLMYSGSISPSIVTGNGITPQLTTASAVTES